VGVKGKVLADGFNSSAQCPGQTCCVEYRGIASLIPPIIIGNVLELKPAYEKNYPKKFLLDTMQSTMYYP
jgi:hypothetical protein